MIEKELVLLEKLFLGISPEFFKKWLKAYYINKHQLLNVLTFENQTQGYYVCYYNSPKPPIIRLKISVNWIVEKFIELKIEQRFDHPNSDTIITQDYVTELVASAIEEELASFIPFEGKTFAQQLSKAGIFELEEQEEQNIIQFLFKYNDAKQAGATDGEILGLRCEYLAAEGRANLIKCLWERYRLRELKATEQELLELNKKILALEEKEADYVEDRPVSLINQIKSLKEDFQIKNEYRKELLEHQ